MALFASACEDELRHASGAAALAAGSPLCARWTVPAATPDDAGVGGDEAYYVQFPILLEMDKCAAVLAVEGRRLLQSYLANCSDAPLCVGELETARAACSGLAGNGSRGGCSEVPRRRPSRPATAARAGRSAGRPRARRPPRGPGARLRRRLRLPRAPRPPRRRHLRVGVDHVWARGGDAVHHLPLRHLRARRRRRGRRRRLRCERVRRPVHASERLVVFTAIVVLMASARRSTSCSRASTAPSRRRRPGRRRRRRRDARARRCTRASSPSPARRSCSGRCPPQRGRATSSRSASSPPSSPSSPAASRARTRRCSSAAPMAPPTPPVRRAARRRRPVEVARVGGVHARRRRDARGDRRPRRVPRRHPLRQCWARRRRRPLLECATSGRTFCAGRRATWGATPAARQGQFCQPSSAAAAAAAAASASSASPRSSRSSSSPPSPSPSSRRATPTARAPPLRAPAGRRRRGDGLVPVAEGVVPGAALAVRDGSVAVAAAYTAD